MTTNTLNTMNTSLNRFSILIKRSEISKFLEKLLALWPIKICQGQYILQSIGPIFVLNKGDSSDFKEGPVNSNLSLQLGQVENVSADDLMGANHHHTGLHKQGKSEGFESCDRPIVRKRPISVKIDDVLSLMTLKFYGWPWKTIRHLSFAVSSFV